MAQHPYDLGRIGLWTGSFQWPDDPVGIAEAAVEIEQLGFGALWIGLSPGDLKLHESVLAATDRLVVASAIVNIWIDAAADVAERHHKLAATYPDRFLLGLGASHAEQVEATGQRYERPLAKLGTYLDELDAAATPVPTGQRILAALGPRALALAAERSRGAHPYLTPPEHTADARRTIGPSKLLVAEQKVFLEADPGKARAEARRQLEFYLNLPNYLNSLRRYGFDDPDFEGGGSDRLIDALVGWGDGAAAVARVQDHLEAGADHVAVQVLPTAPGHLPRAGWRAAAALLS